MKNLGLILIVIVAGLIVIGNIGSIIALAITLAILYFAVKGFMKADTNLAKVVWGAIAVITLLASVGNIPALIGLVALYVLYYLYKEHKREKDYVTSDDPFTNFEKEWEQLNKNYK